MSSYGQQELTPNSVDKILAQEPGIPYSVSYVLQNSMLCFRGSDDVFV